MSGASRRGALLAALILMTAVAACGKKGDPIPPEGATYPRQYPAPRQVLPETAEPAGGTQSAPRNETPSIFPYGRTSTTTYESGSGGGTAP